MQRSPRGPPGVAGGQARSVSSSRGTLVLVAGPSGAGKDSILRYATKRLGHDPAYVFPRRMITRQVDVTAEDHDSLTADEFKAMAQSGGFAFSWEAHGLQYGIPSSILEQLAKGRVASINVSRTIVSEASERYPRTVLVEITAGPELRARRIAARRRESLEDALARQNRNIARCSIAIPSYEIINDGALDGAGEAFCELLRQFKS